MRGSGRLRLASALFAIVGVAPAANGQTAAVQPPAFDAVSVRRAAPDGRTRVELRGDRFVATAVTLWDLVKLAYPLGGRVRNDDQIAGAPAWARSSRFDIVATGGPVSPDLQTTPGAIAPRPGAALTDAQTMLQTLLADRFGLAVHHEPRPLAIYALTRVASDRLGPQLRGAAQCERNSAPDASGAFCGGFGLAGPGLTARAVTMSMLASLLSNLPVVGRIVEDRTGLSGLYDLGLTYSRETAAAPSNDLASNAPSIFTAVQEQLGLKLESTQSTVDVVVIDQAHEPTDN